MAFQALQTLRDNIAAIRITLAYQPGSPLSTEEFTAAQLCRLWRPESHFVPRRVLEKEIARKIRKKQEAQQLAENTSKEIAPANDPLHTAAALPPLEEAIIVSLAGEQAYRQTPPQETEARLRKGISI